MRLAGCSRMVGKKVIVQNGKARSICNTPADTVTVTLAHGFCLKGLVTDLHFLSVTRKQSLNTRKAHEPLETT